MFLLLFEGQHWLGMASSWVRIWYLEVPKSERAVVKEATMRGSAGSTWRSFTNGNTEGQEVGLGCWTWDLIINRMSSLWVYVALIYPGKGMVQLIQVSLRSSCKLNRIGLHVCVHMNSSVRPPYVTWQRHVKETRTVRSEEPSLLLEKCCFY